MVSLGSFDFEEATYALDGWDGTVTAGAGAIVLDNTQVHHGAQSSKSTYNGSGDTGYCYEGIVPSNVVYLRFLVRLDNLPQAGKYSILGAIRDQPNARYLLRVGVDNSAGTYRFYFIWRTNGGNGSATSVVVPPTADAWMTVEVMANLSTNDGDLDGSYQCWVNEVSVWSVSNVDTDSTTATRILVGLDSTNDTVANTIWVDCVEAADAYIGPEAAGVTVRKGGNTALLQALLSGRLFG